MEKQILETPKKTNTAFKSERGYFSISEHLGANSDKIQCKFSSESLKDLDDVC